MTRSKHSIRFLFVRWLHRVVILTNLSIIGSFVVSLIFSVPVWLLYTNLAPSVGLPPLSGPEVLGLLLMIRLAFVPNVGLLPPAAWTSEEDMQ